MVEHFQNFKIETAFNRIAVHHLDDRIELRSGDNALQSVIDLDYPQRLALKNLEYLIAVLLFIEPPQRVLMLGTAGGSLLHFLQHHFPQADIAAVDIDCTLVEEMLRLKILPPASSKMCYVYADARHFMASCNETFDLILVDVFDGAQSPGWLMQQENIQQLGRLLNPAGAVAYNLLINSDHDFRNFYRNLRTVFKQNTLCLPVKGYENTIAYGIPTPNPHGDMSFYMEKALKLSEPLEIDLMRILSVIYNTNPAGAGVI